MLMSGDVKRGNMAGVYLDLAREAEESVRQRDERQGPYHAEIVDGCEPLWHVLIVEPASERITAAHLVGRRFGVYLPEFDKKVVQPSGRVRLVRRRLFPGYLFLFVWDVMRHMRRIRACPGAIHLLFDGSHPAVVPDKLIDRMQAIEAGMINLKADRPRRRRRKLANADETDNEIVSVRCYSALDGVEHLDDGGRISALHRALGLAS